ncbi:hypothetical protein GNP79_19310 [Aliivibrio fischeri]|uniref:Polymerase beta nucleotidyltransferase domain-containing protein n=1 Tax=Aliivibrio fischeri TaxID=668 RepID=A0A6N3YWZ9_ALIFS|nr:nucleotidyltransferase domain-containing protein [Aliivibrio fischeri]MUK45669.1 hypothetical protein [Aliivibrio fischeri]MUK82930.1 hypothetical protein [Aliivibrio fischeri]MUK86606.1 hypothetical protein [Aliivibrio fischeri]
MYRIKDKVIECLQRKKIINRGEQYSEKLVSELIKELKLVPNATLQSVYLYGSRARGNYWKRSDHDFYVVFQDGMPPYFDTSHIDHFSKFNGPLLKKLKLKGITNYFDLMIVDQTKWKELSTFPNTHVDQCIQYGIKLY